MLHCFTVGPRSKAVNDIHKADLVWKPPPELEKENNLQSRHGKSFPLKEKVMFARSVMKRTYNEGKSIQYDSM